MMLFLWLSFVFHFALATQIEFDQAVREKNVFKLCELLQEYDEAQIDPSAMNNRALSLSCKFDNEQLLRILLKDSRVDPGANDCSAFREAVKYLNIQLVEMFLEDGRVTVAPIYALSIFRMTMICPWFFKKIRNIPKCIMELTSASFYQAQDYTTQCSILESLRKESFQILNDDNFNLLLRRAKGQYELKRIIIQKFIQSRNPPDSILQNKRIAHILAKLPIMNTYEIEQGVVRMVKVARHLRHLSTDIAWFITALDAGLDEGVFIQSVSTQVVQQPMRLQTIVQGFRRLLQTKISICFIAFYESILIPAIGFGIGYYFEDKIARAAVFLVALYFSPTIRIFMCEILL